MVDSLFLKNRQMLPPAARSVHFITTTWRHKYKGSVKRWNIEVDVDCHSHQWISSPDDVIRTKCLCQEVDTNRLERRMKYIHVERTVTVMRSGPCGHHHNLQIHVDYFFQSLIDNDLVLVADIRMTFYCVKKQNKKLLVLIWLHHQFDTGFVYIFAYIHIYVCTPMLTYIRTYT